jgi:hypothetical protein
MGPVGPFDPFDPFDPFARCSVGAAPLGASRGLLVTKAASLDSRPVVPSSQIERRLAGQA